MTLFTFKVKDDFFPIIFEGEIEADTVQAAVEQLKDEYAHELDTTSDHIEVLEIKKILLEG